MQTQLLPLHPVRQGQAQRAPTTLHQRLLMVTRTHPRHLLQLMHISRRIHATNPMVLSRLLLPLV